MAILRQGRRQDLVRGAEIARHEYGLYLTALRFSVGMAMVVFAGCLMLGYQFAFARDERALLGARGLAWYHILRGDVGHAVRLHLTLHGRSSEHVLPAQLLLTQTRSAWLPLRRKLALMLAITGVGAGVTVWLTHRAWRQQGKDVAADLVVRGAKFVEPAEVCSQLRRSGRASHVTFAGVPLERGNEVLNTMVTGTIGSGKSVAIAEALSGIRAEQQKAIVFDATGDYVERFYREGRDIILNPFDLRSPLWTAWNEVRRAYDFANVAEGFLPVMNQKEPFWELGAQTVLEDVMYRLAKEGRATNRALVHAINVMSLDEIQELVRSLPAAVYMDPEATRTALSVRMNVVRAAKALRFLDDGAIERQFSIRDWVTSRNQDSWLFLSAREDMLTTVRPLVTAWFDTALRAVMSLRPSRDRLIWSVIDELAALDKISCLLRVATRGRKYGVASILGYQNAAQLRHVYGHEDAQTIISTCQNMLTLRVPDFATAEEVAKNLGKQEVLEKNEQVSFGVDPTRDGVSISARRAMRELVMPAEIQGLKTLHGYLRLAGRNDVMKVAFAYRDYPVVAPAFVDKEITAYDLDQ